MNKIKQLYGEWLSLQPLKPEDQKRLDDKFRLEFNYNSNHLEGNTLTYGQTKLLLIFDRTEGSHELREYEEMKAHDVALKLVIEEANERDKPLTESFIRLLNQIILVRPFWKNAQTPDGQDTRIEVKIGEYKSRPNHVRTVTGEIFQYADVADTPVMMKELVDWYNVEAEKGTLLPVGLAALLHYRFIRIHPFEDGNGRIARLLVNFVLYRFECPPVIVKSNDKNNYLRIINLCDVQVGLEPYKGANATLEQIQPLVRYMSGLLEWSLQIAIRAGKGEDIEEENDWEKKLKLLKRETENDKPVIKKSQEFVQKILDETIKPFFEYYCEKMESFESLFVSNTCYAKFLDSQFNAIDLMSLNMHEIDEFPITIYMSFSNLKKPYYEIKIKTELIYITFEMNVYTLKYGDNIISKFYDETLTKEEMNKIISFIARDLLKKIENLTNS